MILFGDSKIKGRKYASHHDDHIHVCFGENEEESDPEIEAYKKQYRKDVCSKGLETIFKEQRKAIEEFEEMTAFKFNRVKSYKRNLINDITRVLIKIILIR